MSTVEECAALAEKFERVSNSMREMADLIKRVGDRVADGSFHFVNSEVSLPSAAMAIDQDFNISVEQWPTAGQIMVLMKSYHDVRSLTRNAWNSLPEPIRRQMKPPPQGVLQDRAFSRKK
jgi:hypothetical protein